MVLETTENNQGREKFNLVFVGHVDHGKSTLVGRLLADTGSLSKGKLENLREECRKNSKQFEYAYLLDALKDEQSQGITIDVARTFFTTKKRDYIILDAPGHIEFLKNMVTGASKAEGAVLLIDAKEGIRENSKRHAYMLAMLGIEQVLVVVNKMDLINYEKAAFEQIRKEYTEFLKEINIEPMDFIAISAKEGENVAKVSEKMDWFEGRTVLSLLDSFKKDKQPTEKEFRMPVQDIYKFTSNKDDRRMIAGKIETGTLEVGDEVTFYPGKKKSKIRTIEVFNDEGRKKAYAGESIAFTLEDQLYVKRGDLATKTAQKPPRAARTIKANVFWMGKNTLEKDKEYFLKIATTKVRMKIKEFESVLNSSTLDKEKRDYVKQHEVASCKIECYNPIAFEIFSDTKTLGRFVILEEYDIKGGGIITGYEDETEQEVKQRDSKWETGHLETKLRGMRYGQVPCVILLTGKSEVEKKDLAKRLERTLFEEGRNAYYIAIRNVLRGLDRDIRKERRAEHMRRYAEVAYILKNTGLITILTASDMTNQDLEEMKKIIGENFFIVSVEDKSIKADMYLDNTEEQKIKEYLKEIEMIFN